ncbi:accessory Sec system protein Asp1 [Staphylococcus chromogenes]|uniref:Accessory Sec system protein Asp1 n=1 Tax=Staphylococcus chromogenes TaxID=46126 RepID=A0AAE5T2J7_STACR|nr:accessory Sec system protein Asp1 [Staphylococcus chromogenes]PTG17016.1 accessory Sec system protein Asp1 [Staphylococcus chromogenes]
MKRFIPAWYSSHQWWESQAEPFYRKRSITEFDDLISLMAMHQKNDCDFEMMILNYSPHLRTFLHRHDLFESKYWSVFDEIQGFTHQTPQSVDYRQLNWPSGTEFVYTPYLIRAITAKNRYSNIYFSQEGYLIWIEDFENQTKCRRFVFDDRGCLSSVLYFDTQGAPQTLRYMTQDGGWILEENLVQGTVAVHEKYEIHFSKYTYSTMSEVIQEYLGYHRDRTMNDLDEIIIAADVRHNALITKTFKTQRLCFSLFQQRNLDMTEHDLQTIEAGQSWLVDTRENERRLEKYKAKHHLSNRLMRITPFDAQVMPNRSNQLHETYIGLWIDGLSESQLKSVLPQLVHYMEQHEEVRLVLLTEWEKHRVSRWLLNEITAINDRFNHKKDLPEELMELMKEVEEVVYIELKMVPFELDIVEAMTTLRIVIDLSEEPDLFLQICCLGAGLPQINQTETDYVQPGTNGLVINTEQALIPALDYFLTHLKHWNYSYAYSQKLAKNYASEKIIDQLNQLIEGGEYGA